MTLELEFVYGTAPVEPPALPPGIYKLLGHDYQIGDWWSHPGYNRSYPEQKGKPETVATYFKEDRVVMTPAWQWFHYRSCFVYSCFGHFDETLLNAAERKALDNAWGSAMAGDRVITNNTGPDNNDPNDRDAGYRDVIRDIHPDQPYFKYMCLGMGGNLIKLVGEEIYRVGGELSYKFETLNGSQSPPDMREVNFLKTPWLFSRATICRYVKDDNDPLVEILENRWQHVIPFPQCAPWNAHTVLMNISPYGYNYVPVQRCLDFEGTDIPNPCNPAQILRTK